MQYLLILLNIAENVWLKHYQFAQEDENHVAGWAFQLVLTSIIVNCHCNRIYDINSFIEQW